MVDLAEALYSDPFVSSELSEAFSDLTPIPQDDGPVCRIDYHPDFVIAYDWMRAVLAADEHSIRAAKLSQLCLKYNPANYTIWHFRRVCLDALVFHASPALETQTYKDVLDEEFAMTAELGGNNPKNYQIWYHRRAVLEKLNNPMQQQTQTQEYYCRKELNYIDTVLKQDGKNYHAWSHRQWVVQSLAQSDVTIWEQEMEYADTLIQDDVRNNSAWNQRWFASHRGETSKKQQLLLQQPPFSAKEARREAEYAMSGARLDPFNESPWRYLIAILKEWLQIIPNNEERIAVLNEYEQNARDIQEILNERGTDIGPCPNLLSAILDILEWKGDESSLQDAIEIAKSLGSEYDPIRAKYWNFRRQELEAKLVKIPSESVTHF